MPYVANFDPEWHAADPDKDRPFRCTWCDWTGTWEDCESVSTLAGLRGHICPNCGQVECEEVDR